MVSSSGFMCVWALLTIQLNCHHFDNKIQKRPTSTAATKKNPDAHLQYVPVCRQASHTQKQSLVCATLLEDYIGKTDMERLLLRR